jgi:uncharacterized protein YkwD
VSFRLRTVLPTLLFALLVAPAAADARRGPAVANVALGQADVRACDNAEVEPAHGNFSEVREAIRCLHNRIRSANDLPKLRETRKLRRAAARHSRSMVRRGFFEHTAPTGDTMVDRILKARYARRDQGWAFGENLAWGTGSLATPRGAVEAWMDSPGHRANILRGSYRELGVGVVLGVPVSDAEGATYTVDFGVRR